MAFKTKKSKGVKTRPKKTTYITEPTGTRGIVITKERETNQLPEFPFGPQPKTGGPLPQLALPGEKRVDKGIKTITKNVTDYPKTVRERKQQRIQKNKQLLAENKKQKIREQKEITDIERKKARTQLDIARRKRIEQLTKRKKEGKLWQNTK